MSLPVALLLIVTGLALLAGGGEALVRGAISLARRLNVSPAVIGLTIVAMATSLPELAVSLMAALRGSPDVAVGNVVGSNIFNLAAILGVSALVFPPLRFRARMIRFDVAAMTVAGVLAVVVSRNLVVSRIEGIVFLILLGLFLAYRARGARDLDVPDGEGGEAEIESELHTPRSDRMVVALLLIFGGAAVLTFGAEVLVRGAIRMAEIAGLSERVIGITLVSAGTGLPELATAIMAGRRHHSAVAVGNVIGSNIFNVFGILGTVAIVKPIPVSALIAARDMWWMVGFSVATLALALLRGVRVTRLGGAVAIAIYVLYITTLL